MSWIDDSVKAYCNWLEEKTVISRDEVTGEFDIYIGKQHSYCHCKMYFLSLTNKLLGNSSFILNPFCIFAFEKSSKFQRLYG